jgi:hypothetical protein
MVAHLLTTFDEMRSKVIGTIIYDYKSREYGTVYGLKKVKGHFFFEIDWVDYYYDEFYASDLKFEMIDDRHWVMVASSIKEEEFLSIVIDLL